MENEIVRFAKMIKLKQIETSFRTFTTSITNPTFTMITKNNNNYYNYQTLKLLNEKNVIFKNIFSSFYK
jgi:hypothetical protein